MTCATWLRIVEAPFFKLFKTPLNFVNCKSSCGAFASDSGVELLASLFVFNFVAVSCESELYCGGFAVLIWAISLYPLLFPIAVYGNLHEDLIGSRFEKLCEKYWRALLR